MLPTSSRTTWRVVIVDDNTEDREDIRRLLLRGSERRYAFAEAATAADGIRLIRDPDGPPDCVILDYLLPDAHAPDVLAALAGPDGAPIAPVVVITINTGPEFGSQALRAGAQDFVGKSWMTVDSLTRAVENAVERWAMARELRASEARFRHLAAAVPQAVWMADAAGQVVYASERWSEYFGPLDPACERGHWNCVMHPEDLPPSLALLVDCAARRCAYQRDCRLRRADGQYRWHQINAVPIFDSSGALVHWYGVNTDIHHRTCAEQRLAVAHTVSRILAAANRLDDAIPPMLGAIAAGLDMDPCALWLVDEDGTALRCVEVFAGPTPDRLASFVAATRNMRCRAGASLPGMVWQTRRTEWIESLATHPGFVRANAAVEAGLTSGLAFPLMVGETVLGVIELFSARSLPEDAELLAMLSALGSELAQFILRKRAERAVEDNEARLRLALEASRTGIWTWDLITDAVVWTAECYEIHGISREGFGGTGAAFFQLVHPDDRERVERTVRTAIDDRSVYACEFRVVAPTRATVWVQNRGRASYGPNGEPLQMLGTITDIDERMRASELLAASEDQLARAQRAARVGTWDWNLVTGEASWTDEAWRVFCGEVPIRTAVSYERWIESVHPDDRDRAAAAVRASIPRGHYRDQFRVRHHDGAVRWVEAVADVVHADDGTAVRVIGTARDITEQREADRALRAALERAESAVQTRERLVSLVSHDLRNPLSVLALEISFLEMFGERLASDPTQLASRVQRMARQTATMTQLIDELLDVASLHAGKSLSLVIEEVDLVELTRGAVADHQRTAPRHRIELRTPAEPLIGAWDRRRLERVIGNLLSNAVKYSPAGGTVTVEIDRLRLGNAHFASVRVKDDGIGIPAADRPRIFHWFSRAGNAVRAEIPGTGIGLAGTKQIVEQHGGSIAVESVEGQGTVFTVKLPVAPAGDPHASRTAESERTTSLHHEP